MTHKVQILEIEHVQHASRIIIKYYLEHDTAAFESDGWIYVPNVCGYKGICDTEWVQMEPNVQHPLHSDIIKQHGVYYFVWDYLGVGGLSNENFTSTHSFVIQLGLQDTGCGWTDPCIEDPNYTPSGQVVDGNIGEEGNCGSGYVIVLDDRGCLMCRLIPDVCDNTIPGDDTVLVAGTPGTQGNCPPGWHIEIDSEGCPYCVQDHPATPGGNHHDLPPTIDPPPDDGDPPWTSDPGGPHGGITTQDIPNGGGICVNDISIECEPGAGQGGITDDIIPDDPGGGVVGTGPQGGLYTDIIPEDDPGGGIIITQGGSQDGGLNGSTITDDGGDCGGFICEPGGDLGGTDTTIIGDGGGLGIQTYGEGYPNDGGSCDGCPPPPPSGISGSEDLDTLIIPDDDDPEPPGVLTWGEGSVGGNGDTPPGIGGTATNAGQQGSFDESTNYFNSYTNDPRFNDAHYFRPSTEDVPIGPTVVGTGPKLPKIQGVPNTGDSTYSFVGYPSTNILGEIPNWSTPDGIDVPLGDGSYSTSPGRISRSKSKIIKGVYGARLPLASNSVRFYNSNRYNSYITERFSSRHDPPSDNELGLTTRHFKKNQNFTLNSVANTTTFRGNTNIKNAISVKNNVSYIESSQNFRNNQSFLRGTELNKNIAKTEITGIGQRDKRRETRPARNNIHDRGNARERHFGVQDHGPISSSFQRNISLGSRSPAAKTTNRNNIAAKNYEVYRSDNGFLGSNRVSLSVVPSQGAIGSMFHASCVVKPYEANQVQTLSLEMYIRDSIGTNQLIRKTHRVTTRANRRLAGLISTKDLQSGEASIFFVVKDQAGKVIYKEHRNVTLTSPGQLAGVPDKAVMDSLGATSNDFVSGLIAESSISTITLPIHSNVEGPLKLILNKDQAKSRIQIGVQTTSQRGRREHAISIYNITGFAESQATTNFANVSKPLFLSDELLARSNPESAGPGLTNKPANTSAVTYTELLGTSVDNQIIATIGNHNIDRNSLVKIEVGGDVEIVPFTTTSVNNLDGTYTLTIQTPLSFTDLSLFETGGNNVVSASPTITNARTSQTGVIVVTMTINRDAWLAIALKEPSNLSLSARTFYFTKIE